MAKPEIKWRQIPLMDAVDYDQPNPYIITTKIKESGKYPVLTAGKSFIKGYTKEIEGVYKRVPVIIFDDFTTASKYVDFEFKVKSSAMKILKAKTSNINVKYVFYQMKLIKINASTHKRYYISKYQHLQFLFPFNGKSIDIDAQNKILDSIETQLTRLDASIKTLQSVRKKLELYRKSVLKGVFCGENKKLSEIVKKDKHALKRGPFGGSLKKEIFVKNSEYLVYEQRHAIHNDFDYKKYYITKKKYDEMIVFKVVPYDLIISCSGVTLGRISEIPENAQAGIINQALLKVSLDSNIVLNKYFIHLFQSELMQRPIRSLSRGAAIPNLPSVKNLKEIVFPIPSIEKQKQIISEIESRFSVIDKIEETVNHSLVKAEKLRQSILKSIFEGKLVKEGVCI